MEKCVCYDGDFDNCPYSGTVITVKINGFKDESPTYEKRCQYQLYIGSSIVISNFTKKEFNQLIKESTLCTY